jgi:hypothetical protein
MNPLSPTYAQLGDATEPQGHARTDLQDGRDTLPANHDPEDGPGLSRYAFRMRGTMAKPTTGRVNDGYAGTSTVADHESVGAPDPRRQADALTVAGYPRSPERTTSGPEWIRTEPHGAVAVDPSPGLTVNRAGGTTEDPAHVAGVPRFLYDRPFDQDMAHHPLTVSKLERPSPLASAPINQTVGTPGGQPSPGGVSGITRMSAFLGDHRNTVRQVPTPWDETAVVGTDVQPVTSSPVRRLR